MNDNIKSKETEVYNNGLSRTCRYLDFSRNRVCYFGDKATGIIDCIGCHEDGRNAEVDAQSEDYEPDTRLYHQVYYITKQYF